MCQELGRRESRRGQAPGAAGPGSSWHIRAPPGSAPLWKKARPAPSPQPRGLCLRLPCPPQEARAPDSGWSRDTGSRSDWGQELRGERARWGRGRISGWSGPRAFCWQRLPAGPRSGWGSVLPHRSCGSRAEQWPRAPARGRPVPGAGPLAPLRAGGAASSRRFGAGCRPPRSWALAAGSLASAGFRELCISHRCP